jgi:hypothetical protein
MATSLVRDAKAHYALRDCLTKVGKRRSADATCNGGRSELPNNFLRIQET